MRVMLSLTFFLICLVFVVYGLVELAIRVLRYTKEQIEGIKNPVFRQIMKWTYYYKKKAQQAALDAIGEPPETKEDQDDVEGDAPG